jgi:hypothetical protein
MSAAGVAGHTRWHEIRRQGFSGGYTTLTDYLRASAPGRLEMVDLRLVWSSESGSFTPWLALDDNLMLLGEAIDIDLELEAQEKCHEQ